MFSRIGESKLHDVFLKQLWCFANEQSLQPIQNDVWEDTVVSVVLI